MYLNKILILKKKIVSYSLFFFFFENDYGIFGS